jgi:hypothetical protein
MLIARYKMKSYNEDFNSYSKTLFPGDFKKEDAPNTITYRCKSNNFMQSNCSDPFLMSKATKPGSFSIEAIWPMWPSKRPFLLGRKGASGSWAEPYFACPTLSLRGFAYPPGILYRVFTGKKEENRILSGILYRYLKAYPAIQSYASTKI